MKFQREWWVTGMLFLLTVINSVDRLVLASVAPILQATFHLSNKQYSYVVIAFMAGMTLGQLPSGALLDRIGVLKGLPLIVVGWSLVTGLHVFARQVWQFSVLRFLMGAFESGNYSGGLKAIASNLPAARRAVGLGVFNSGFIVGSVIAPPIVVFTAAHFGWKAAFLVPAVVGSLWVFPWLRVCRRSPESFEPLPETEQIGFLSLLKVRETWGVILARATAGPISQFYWYWLPLYLVRGRGASMSQMSTLAGLAYFMGACGSLAGGHFSGILIRRNMDVRRSRKLTFGLGTALCSLATLCVPFAPSIAYADLLVGMAIFGVNVMACMLLSIMSDVFPSAGLARVGGLTGAAEGIVSIVLTLATGIILDRFNFSHVFVAASVLPLLSATMLFLLVRSKVAPPFAALPEGL